VRVCDPTQMVQIGHDLGPICVRPLEMPLASGCGHERGVVLPLGRLCQYGAQRPDVFGELVARPYSFKK
jgi:hypothetical protein